MLYTYRSTGAGDAVPTTIKPGGASQDMWVNVQSMPGYTDPNCYLLDADGAIRRPMGGYVPTKANTPDTAVTTIGLPLATVNGNTSNQFNRPILLNRPFRTVSELGYVFSNYFWRNIGFCTPESGCAALLDLFSVSDAPNIQSPMVAGKVDLNTRQAPVLRAVLAGAARNEPGLSGSNEFLSGTAAAAIANALIARTTGTASPGQGPLANISELVGRYVSGTPLKPVYDGFSADLGVFPPTLLPTTTDPAILTPNNLVTRLREAAIRAFSGAGQAGTWNLLIDLIAQVGRYPRSASNARDFMVEGERHYWLHVAIDRQTGELIESQIELISE